MEYYQVKLFSGDWMTVSRTVYDFWFGQKRIIRL